MLSRLFALCGALLAGAVLAGTSAASQLIDRNATGVTLQVDRQGRALLDYTAVGRKRHVLVVGNAINAVPPGRGRRQAAFTVDYGGGWGLYHKTVWQSFRNACSPYDGPPLAWFVTACKGPDGSYWALQAFPQPLPNLGFAPWQPAQRATWLELSHWTGPLASLEVWQDWVYDGRYNEVYGRLSYQGKPVYGFGTTQFGAPTDKFGRLLYLDTFGSAYGAGWRRENSFVAHNPTGIFCYGFYPFDPTRGGYEHPPGQAALRGPGVGLRYRITAQGPGVTPDVMWQGEALHPFQRGNTADVGLQQQAEAQLASILGVDKLCRHGHSI